MNSKTLILLSISLLAAACQKRKYPDEKVQLEKEDIYFNGYIGNEPINLKIGTDGYYCYSSCMQRPDSIYVFGGELKKFDCTSCPLTLRIELSDYRQRSPGSPVPPDSTFRTGSKHYIPLLEKTNTIKFESQSNKEISWVRWDLSNGLFSFNPILNYEFGQPGVQTVSLTVRTKDGCESVVVNKIFIGAEGDLFACGIESQTIQNTTAQFTSSRIGGKAPCSYTWNFGDGSISNAPNPTHTYTYSGSYPVKLRIEDGDHHVCESNFIHIAGDDKSSCAANMSLSHTGSRNAFLNGAKIQWTDQANVVFRSDSVAQPAESYFEILRSEPYDTNEKGEAGRLLTLRFNVLLSDGNRKLWFKSETTAIAVTYK